MSVNLLGPRKVRQLAARTGLDIDRAFVWSDGRWVYARIGNGPGHSHVVIDRRTGAVESDHGHFSSCEGVQ